MTAPLYLGVDGGGTKTEFICIDADRQIVARTATGTTYHLQIGLDGAIATLRSGVADVCRQAGIAPADLAFAFFGLPAYGEDNLIDPQLERACGAILGHSRYACGNDMICGWAGSFACADGLNLVAGTGSIGYGQRRGVAARVGGWGETFSDEGSAYWIAIQGLNAFTRMSDGRLPKSVLHDRFRDALSLQSDIDLCARIMGERGMTREEIAGLATIVSAAAGEGDPVASAILADAARELVEIARALRAKLAFEPGEIASISWSGGVLSQEEVVRTELLGMLGRTEGFDFTPPLHPPGLGAAFYALHLATTAARLP